MTDSRQQKPILPLRSTVLFPGCVGTVQINRKQSLNLLDEIEKNGGEIILLPLRHIEVDNPSQSDLSPIGVLARLIVTQRTRDDNYSVTFEAEERVSLIELLSQEPYLVGKFNVLKQNSVSIQLSELAEKLYRKAVLILKGDSHYSPEILQLFKANRNDVDKFVDIVSQHIHFSFEAQRELLITPELKKRIDLLDELLTEEVERVELESELKTKAEESLLQTRRELFLRMKLKEIQKELGEDTDQGNVAISYRSRVEMTNNLPIEVKEQVFIETERLRALPTASGEYGSIKRYLDWLLLLPWNKEHGEESNLKKVEKVISRSFYGSKDIKNKVIEYIAIKRLSENISAPTLCLSGPPGTGKAALASAIAQALGRKLKRFSVAGLLSDAEIKGEPRTLPEALPGKIVTTLIEADCNNPVIFIEDLDRLSADETRLSASLALLEVIDTRQNKKFFDYYIGLPIDLSKVIFIFSVRGTEPIPEVLLDRMQLIEFNGYIDREKLAIAESYLIPDLLKQYGIQEPELSFTEGAIKILIQSYTMEAGLSQMKSRIETLCRKYLRARATSQRKVKWMITEDNLEEYFGTPIYIPETAISQPEIGVAAGVAWTGVGGDIMIIEGLKMHGEGGVTCTGSLGEIMRESVQAAHSFVRSKADLLNIPYEDFNLFDIHIHFPQGAIPKDGPSAGVTISLVIASVMSNRPIRNDIAMTGEVSLRGKVLPVSGVKEKVAAAHRAGIYKFVMPSQNKKDLKDISSELKGEMEFIFIDRTDQLFEIALLDYKPGAETIEDLLILEMREQEMKKNKKSAKSRLAHSKPVRRSKRSHTNKK